MLSISYYRVPVFDVIKVLTSTLLALKFVQYVQDAKTYALLWPLFPIHCRATYVSRTINVFCNDSNFHSSLGKWRHIVTRIVFSSNSSAFFYMLRFVLIFRLITGPEWHQTDPRTCCIILQKPARVHLCWNKTNTPTPPKKRGGGLFTWINCKIAMNTNWKFKG